jgi:nucleotide-binding universal stress UspA family protein
MKRFNKVLCVIDTDIDSEAAVIHAMKIANDHQADIAFASLIEAPGIWHSLVHSQEETNSILQEAAARERIRIENWLENVAPGLEASIEIYSGTEFIQIIKSVIKNQFDLVVKCARSSGWLDRLFGSEDMHLLRKCPCPVLMLKPGQKETFRRILATVDVNDNLSALNEGCVQEQLNKKVLEYSAALGISELTELHVGGAWVAFAENFYRYGTFSHVPEERVDFYVEQAQRECSDKMDLLVREMRESVGSEAVQHLLPRTHLIKGFPATEIPLLAEKLEIDLIVMGTVGRIGIPGLIIGNTAESILEQVKCSVLALKPEGFESPVQ